MKANPFKISILCVVLLMSNACEVHQKHSYKLEEIQDVENYAVPVSEEIINNDGYLYDYEVNFEHTSENFNTEEYDRINENDFLDAFQNPLSTFSIDVDNAAYSNVRRFLNTNQLPPKDAVRIEEMINYFSYNYPQPKDQHPFSFTNEVAVTPWNTNTKLVHIGIQGKSINYENLKSSNLVFLIDASGSMSDQNKLPLVKKGLKLLLNKLNANDSVAIVAYAGAAGLVLKPTKASEKEIILNALDRIDHGGSTAGGQGIELAYKIAKDHLIKDGNNRVILATDGDFNIGVSSSSDLVRLIETKRKDGIYLTICGFGMGNYKDHRMEQTSNAGNGNYFYIDHIKEAQKVFVTEMRANMFTIAKDVKIQIEFNPSKVKAYRLIGYENRILEAKDFNDDKKDAGELGAGHTVTALYEIIPSNSKLEVSKHDKLKYVTSKPTVNSKTNDLYTIKFRYKKPNEDKSKLITKVVKDITADSDFTSDNFRFSASVAGFGLLLRDSKYKGAATYNLIKALAESAKGEDKNGYREDYINLVETAMLLQ